MDPVSTPLSPLSPLPPVAPQASAAQPVKPGWQTTEFWVHACAIAGIIATALSTAGLPPSVAAWCVVATSASYGISRGLAKMGS